MLSRLLRHFFLLACLLARPYGNYSHDVRCYRFLNTSHRKFIYCLGLTFCWNSELTFRLQWRGHRQNSRAKNNSEASVSSLTRCNLTPFLAQRKNFGFKRLQLCIMCIVNTCLSTAHLQFYIPTSFSLLFFHFACIFLSVLDMYVLLLNILYSDN